MRAAVFGDVGGHAPQFFAALQNLGVNLQTGSIPEDLHIIQVGDLIHKGPDTDEVVSVVGHLMHKSPNQWTQLIGNHEAMHLGMSGPFYHCNCSRATLDTLKTWWTSGKIHLAAGFSGVARKRLVLPDTLLTHAGLTAGAWSLMDRPKTVTDAVDRIKSSPLGVFGRPGVMLGGRTRWNAGVFWAHSTLEAFPSWGELVMPFNQVHGHCPPFNWDRTEWYPSTPKNFRAKRDNVSAYLEDRAYVYRTEDGGSFVCIDPGFEVKVPVLDMQPYLLVDEFVKIA